MSAPARAPERGGRTLSEPLVAVLARRGRLMVAEPIFERGRRVSLDPRGRGDAGPGDLVLLQRAKRGSLRVARVIGRPDVAQHVLEGLMLERGLRRSFGVRVEDEAGEAAASEGGGAPRHDLTSLATFTIDPESARDFDDAVSARREGDRVRVWVHIADVSAFVKPGTSTDREAVRRTTSVYVPGAVEPMLPRALSDEACSLVPGAERLAVTVEMEMEGAEVRSVSFYRSRIRSDTRLAYEEVDEVFAGTRPASEPWGEPLAAAREVAAALSARRAERGSLDLETPGEPRFTFDGEGNVTGTEHETQTESHRLIEQLMVLANEQVASYLAERRAPTLYRVHERPEPAAVRTLIDKLASLDVPTPPLPERLGPQEAGELAGEASRLVAAHVRRTGNGGAALSSLVLRSLKQAFYTPKNLGHAGLASPRYCHFTSPIRRYPDLVVHRALLAALGAGEEAHRGSELPEMGEECSAGERHALQIERDADDVCAAFLLERTLAEQGLETTFEGEVVGLIGAGAFVRFGEEGFEGFLPVRRLRGDWWSLTEEETALVAEHSGRRLSLGDSLEVAVARVEAPRGRVDLIPASDLEG